MNAQKNNQINWQKDIRYLKEELPGNHKNIFFKVSRDTFENRLNRIENMAKLGMPDLQVVLRIQEVIAAMGDSHTGVKISSWFDQKHSFPFKIYWFTDGPFIIAASDTYRNILGKKIIAVNGLPWDSVVMKLTTLLTIDNESMLHQYIPDLLIYGDLLHVKEISSVDSVSLTLESNQGKQEVVTILSQKQLPFDPEQFVFIESANKAGYLKNAKQLFWLDYQSNDSVLYFGYNKCWSRELEEQYGDRTKAALLPSFTACTDSIFNLSKAGLISKLIVDFRMNGGGASPQGSMLAGKIAGDTFLNQYGKLFVVTGRRTFSSAVLNVMDFKKATRAIIIGEPTGGKPNHYGEVKKLKLPSSGLTVSFSTKYFFRDEANSNAIYPDEEVGITFGFYEKGIDPVYETIRNWKNER